MTPSKSKEACISNPAMSADVLTSRPNELHYKKVATMRQWTARQLKNRTGLALRYASQGESLLITIHGTPVAKILPASATLPTEEGLRPIETAWQSITEALQHRPPRFKTWKEAMKWSRRRS